jgi:6,7-dimethyl-8-ribityllumazine synthase
MAASPTPLAPAPRIEGVRVMIVAAAYYQAIARIVEAMVMGAERVVKEAGGEALRIDVPGALEIPGAIAAAHHASTHTRLPSIDAYVALGCVIRGETGHYDIVAGQSARGLMDLTINPGLAIGNGVLTVEDEAQAWARAQNPEPNKGAEAARAALAMVALTRRFAGLDAPVRAP